MGGSTCTHAWSARLHARNDICVCSSLGSACALISDFKAHEQDERINLSHLAATLRTGDSIPRFVPISFCQEWCVRSQGRAKSLPSGPAHAIHSPFPCQ